MPNLASNAVPPASDQPDADSYGSEELMIYRLREAVEWSRRRMQAFREHRYEAIRQYVGAHYSEDGAPDIVPVNLLELAINIYSRHLVSSNPSALVTTQHKRLKAFSETLSLALDHLLDEIDFGETLRRCVIDALFGVGILKIGLERHAEVEIGGFLHDVGQPFVDCVDLDDFVWDMSAKRWEDIGFAGNRYRLPLDVVRSAGIYRQEVADQLTPTYKQNYNEYGDEKVETISQGFYQDRDEYKDYVELWDFWLPLENRLLTVAADQEGGPEGRILRLVDWEGPEGGPFRLLSFSPVPSAIMPLSPVALWMDLHDLCNRVYRKLGRQAERQKTFVGARMAQREDAERIANVNDGEIIGLDDPQATQEFRTGGIDEPQLTFFIQARQLFAYLAGNIDAIGGLGPQSETATQDQMLTASASKRVADMQDRVVTFTSQVLQDLAWYLWTDPLIDLPLIKRRQGIEIETRFNAENKEGDFLDYHFQIDPYSMSYKTPSMRLQQLLSLYQQVVLPSLPLMAQQGVHVDFPGLIEMLARYANLPELKDILLFLGEQPESPPSPGGSEQRTPKPPVSTRNYVRENRPSSTIQGNDMRMMQALMGTANNDQRAGSLYGGGT